MPEIKYVQLVIFGSDPGGYSVVVCAARVNLNPDLITKIEVRGQLTTTREVDNWPRDIEGQRGGILVKCYD